MRFHPYNRGQHDARDLTRNAAGRHQSGPQKCRARRLGIDAVSGWSVRKQLDARGSLSWIQLGDALQINPQVGIGMIFATFTSGLDREPWREFTRRSVRGKRGISRGRGQMYRRRAPGRLGAVVVLRLMARDLPQAIL